VRQPAPNAEESLKNSGFGEPFQLFSHVISEFGEPPPV
jgi:hypothetical protein